jgi:hypothetical protein
MRGTEHAQKKSPLSAGLKTIFLEENSGDGVIMQHRNIQVQWSFVMSAIHAAHIMRRPMAAAGVERLMSMRPGLHTRR